MASRIIHLAVSAELAGKTGLPDTDRFLFGAVIPDAAPKSISHRKIILPSGKKTYDLTGFREEFSDKLKTDELYLGFYLHLIQDIYYRQFVYNKYHWDPAPPGSIMRLHNDYALMNPYIIEKYHLKNTVYAPPGVKNEPLFGNGVYPVENFLAEFKKDFTRRAQGEVFFFTREMADEFIALAAEKCVEETEALYTGKALTDELELAW